MGEVAAAAGVARATVYRYFPSREALLTELADVAVAEAAVRVDAARIGEVAVEEGIGRAIRALADAGDYFVVLTRNHVPQAADAERRLNAPLRRLIERGQADGGIRRDVAASWLAAALAGLIAHVLAAASPLGREDTIAAIKSLFLDGARARDST